MSQTLTLEEARRERKAAQDFIDLFALSADDWTFKEVIRAADDAGMRETAAETIRESSDKEEALAEVLDMIRDQVRSNILDIQERRRVDVVLSTGGPETGIEFICDKDGEALYARYYVLEWFKPRRYILDLDEGEIEALAQAFYITDFYY